MSVSLRTSTVTGNSVCGVVWCGVVWCGLSLLQSHSAPSVVLFCVLFYSTLSSSALNYSLIMLFYSILYYSVFFSSLLRVRLRTSLLFLLFPLCYLTTVSSPSLPSTSLHFDAFHFTLKSSLNYNPILSLILMMP